MKYFKYLFVVAVLGCSCVLPARADDDTLLDIIKETREKNKDLENEIKDKDAQIKRLTTQLQRAETARDQAEEELRQLRDDNAKHVGDSKSLEDEIIRLQGEINSLQNELSRVQGESNTAFERERQGYVNQIEQLSKQNTQFSDRIAALEKERAEMLVFRRQMVESKVKDVDTKWMNRPFAQINPAELDADLEFFNEFPKENGVQAAIKKLNALKNSYLVYQDAVEVVNNPYDARKVAAITPKITALANSSSNAANKKDLDTLAKQLKYYKESVQIFQEVIMAVDDQVKTRSNHVAALPFVEMELEKQAEYENIDAINEVPWLARQYKDYVAGLKKNCKNTEIPARVMIMSLKP